MYLGLMGKDDVVDIFLHKLMNLRKPTDRFTVHSANRILVSPN